MRRNAFYLGIGVLFVGILLYGCGSLTRPSSTQTLTVTGQISNGAAGAGPKAKSLQDISRTLFSTITAAKSGLAGIKSARVNTDGNFTLEFNVASDGVSLSSADPTRVPLIFARNGFNSTRESFTFSGTEEVIDMGVITIEAASESADPAAIATTHGSISLFKQTRDPYIPYGDDSGRIGPDPNDIYSARQRNADVDIQSNQWYYLLINVSSNEGSTRIKAYLDEVLVMDEIDSSPYTQDYYADLRNGSFAIEADAGGETAAIAIDNVVVQKDESTVFSDDFESRFASSTQEGGANWWAMNGSWEVVSDGSNHYLRGESEAPRYQAFLFYPSYSDKSQYSSWINYIVRFRFKLLDSNSSLHFRCRHRFNEDPALSGDKYIGNTSYMLVVAP